MDPFGTGPDVVPAGGPTLTRREREIAAVIALGHTNAGIARTLGISPTTAKWHVSRILQKLSLTSRVQLAVYAQTSGLTLPLPE